MNLEGKKLINSLNLLNISSKNVKTIPKMSIFSHIHMKDVFPTRRRLIWLETKEALSVHGHITT